MYSKCFIEMFCHSHPYLVITRSQVYLGEYHGTMQLYWHLINPLNRIYIINIPLGKLSAINAHYEWAIPFPNWHHMWNKWIFARDRVCPIYKISSTIFSISYLNNIGCLEGGTITSLDLNYSLIMCSFFLSNGISRGTLKNTCKKTIILCSSFYAMGSISS